MLIDFGGPLDQTRPPDFLPYLPKDPKPPLGCEVYQYYRPYSGHEQCSEYYGYVTLPNRTWIAFLGEFAYFGCVGPLQLAARISGQLSCLLRAGLSLEETLKQVNWDLIDLNLDRFTQLLICSCDLEKGVVEVVNAGAFGPLIVHADGRITKISGESSGLPLGIVSSDDYQMEPTALDFKSGDCVVMFSDGLPEATDKDDTAFGTDRIESHLKRHATEPTRIGEAIAKDFEEFTQGNLVDDVTLITMARSVGGTGDRRDVDEF